MKLIWDSNRGYKKETNSVFLGCFWVVGQPSAAENGAGPLETTKFWVIVVALMNIKKFGFYVLNPREKSKRIILEREKKV